MRVLRLPLPTALHGIFCFVRADSMDASDLRRDLLLRESPSRRPSRSRREKAERAASRAHPMVRLRECRPGQAAPGVRVPSRQSRRELRGKQALPPAAGVLSGRHRSIRCSRLLYGRRCVLASGRASPDAAGRSGGPLATRCGPPVGLPVSVRARNCASNLATAGRGAALSCSARSTC